MKPPQWKEGYRSKAVIMTALLLASMGGALVERTYATISTAPSNYVSAYSCEKGFSYIVFVDNAATPVYYAVAGSGLATQSCGNLVYGGPNNAGGITGTNAALVLGNAINNTVTLGGGTVFLEVGVYVLTGAIDLYESVWLQGANQGWTSKLNGAVLQTSGNYPAIIFSNYLSNRLMGHLSNVLLYGTNLIGDKKNVGLVNNDTSTFDFYVDHVSVSLFYTGVQCISGAKLRMSDSTIEGNLKYGIYENSGYLTNFYDDYIRTNGLGNSGLAGLIINPTSFQLEDSQVVGNNAGLELENTVAGNYQYQIIGDTFMSNTGSNGFNYNLYLFQGDTIVTGNTFSFDATLPKPAYDIQLYQSRGLISSNYFQSTAYTVSVFNIVAGTQPTTVIVNNQGFNPVGVTTFTAGPSVYTYTNTNGYDIQFYLTTAAGISVWTCAGITLAITAGTSECITPPGGTMAITWTVTAPVFKGIPLEG